MRLKIRVYVINNIVFFVLNKIFLSLRFDLLFMEVILYIVYTYRRLHTTMTCLDSNNSQEGVYACARVCIRDCSNFKRA